MSTAEPCDLCAGGGRRGVYRTSCVTCCLALLRDAPAGAPRRAMAAHLAARVDDSELWERILAAARAEGLTTDAADRKPAPGVTVRPVTHWRPRITDVMSPRQIEDARQVGMMRGRANGAIRGPHRWGWQPQDDEYLTTEIQSAISEAFIAAATGRKWLSNGLVVDKPEDGDIEGGYGVRWTSRENGSLIVHEDEKTVGEALVVGCDEHQVAIGWLATKPAQQPKFWRTNVRHPAFFVPQSALLDLRELVMRKPVTPETPA